MMPLFAALAGTVLEGARHSTGFVVCASSGDAAIASGLGDVLARG